MESWAVVTLPEFGMSDTERRTRERGRSVFFGEEGESGAHSLECRLRRSCNVRDSASRTFLSAVVKGLYGTVPAIMPLANNTGTRFIVIRCDVKTPKVVYLLIN